MKAPDFARLGADTIVAFIADIFQRRGADSYLGEPVTMSQHMLQAALLAENAEAGDALVAAALLHDIGHYTSEFPPDAQDQSIDNRHNDVDGPMITLVPRASSVEERFKSLKMLRPRFKLPNKISAIWWPRYIASLEETSLAPTW